LSRSWLRLALLATIVGAGALALLTLPVQRVPELIGRLGAVGPVAAVAMGATLLALLFPRTVLSLACGALFGPIVGGTTALIAAIIAGVATFAIGRWAGREVVQRRLRGRLLAIDTFLAKRGLLAVVVTRLIPIGPFGLIGYLYGTSATRAHHYAGGTAIGAAPSSFSYAAIGAAVVAPASMSWLTYAPAAAGALVSTAAALYWRYTARRES
jgi:uncharacterized membrane protein YdjX (TVP38/TMEM64 family)